MDAKKCDRCFKYFNADDFYLNLNIKKINNKWETVATLYDLCEECSKNFSNFLLNIGGDKNEKK